VYRKGARPFNANITNVGVEAFFYTHGDDTLADDLITDAEGAFSNLVRRLRGTIPTALSDPQLPQLIAHLEVRTRHLRQSFLRAGDYLVSRLLDFVADERSFMDYFERTLRNDPSILRKSFSDHLAKCGLPETMLEPMLKLGGPLLPAILAPLGPMLPKLAEELRSVLPKIFNEAAKSGHIRALKQAVSPEVRTEWYKDLTYSLVDADDHLILGDSAVLFHIEGTKPYKAFLEKQDILDAVFLPLSPRRVLVGARESVSAPPPDLRQVIARCALEYFIADENCEANDPLQERIGEDASLLTEAELEEIISGIMNE
jgi:hypothetical protein